jgi:hypothetical protein
MRWDTIIEAHEAFRHAAAVFGRDAVSMVGDGDHHLVAVAKSRTVPNHHLTYAAVIAPQIQKSQWPSFGYR